MRRGAAIGLCTSVVLAAWPMRGGLVQAQPEAGRSDQERIARAEAAFRKGVAAFDAGSLEKALAHYRESYALWPRARTLLNLGLVTRKLGRLAEAANFFAQYLDDDAADAARVPAVRKALGELDLELGRLTITLAGEGELTVDGLVVAEAELARPLRVVPGPHRLQQDAIQEEVEVTKGQELAVTVGKREVKPPPPPPPRPEPAAPTVEVRQRAPVATPRRWYLWTAVPTVLAGGATLYFGLRYRSQQAELDDILAQPTLHDYSEAVAARDRAQTSALYTNLGLGVTGLGLAATGVLFLLRPRPEPATPTLSLVPGVGSLAITGAW